MMTGTRLRVIIASAVMKILSIKITFRLKGVIRQDPSLFRLRKKRLPRLDSEF